MVLFIMPEKFIEEKTAAGIFGEINHYDASGHKIGESRPKLFSGWNNYDD